MQEQLTRLLQAEPFIPFAILTCDEQIHVVANPKWLLLDPEGKGYVYVDAKRSLVYTDYREIVRVELDDRALPNA